MKPLPFRHETSRVEVVQEITITSGDANTGDGITTPRQVQRTTPDISSMRFVGLRPSGRSGLGLDDFKARP